MQLPWERSLMSSAYLLFVENPQLPKPSPNFKNKVIKRNHKHRKHQHHASEAVKAFKFMQQQAQQESRGQNRQRNDTVFPSNLQFLHVPTPPHYIITNIQ